jgi:hypothetical protein
MLDVTRLFIPGSCALVPWWTLVVAQPRRLCTQQLMACTAAVGSPACAKHAGCTSITACVHAQEAFDPAKGIFLRTDEGAIYPNPAAPLPPQPPGKPPYSAGDVFRLLGSILGKAMYEGIIVELPLAAFFLKKLRGGSSDLNDLPSLDRQLYRNLLELSRPDTDFELLGLTFTIKRSAASADEADVPLMPGAFSATAEQRAVFVPQGYEHQCPRAV